MEIVNRKAKFDYFIEREIEAGIVLTGTEIKSIRNGSADLKDSYGLIKNNEVYLLNFYIAKYDNGNRFNHEERRTRKLLLHKKEVNRIASEINKEGYSFIPLKLYIKKSHAKVLMGVAKGKHIYDKRQTIKERQLNKEAKNVS